MVSLNYAALRAAREKKGFTRAQLSEMAGCKEDFLRDIESEKKRTHLSRWCIGSAAIWAFKWKA